jgi:hypothetical protein
MDKTWRSSVDPKSRPDEKKSASREGVPPRLLRLRDAPRYLGMDKNRFNREVRPLLTVIPIGRQGIAFDRLDLDAWVDEYKRRNGVPPALSEAAKPWGPAEPQGVASVGRFEIATRASEERAFARALQRSMPPRRGRRL